MIALSLEDNYGRSILASFHGLWSLAGFSGAGIGAVMIYLDILPKTHYLIISSVVLVVLLMAQGYQESQLNQAARSPRGAVGIMQLLPTTAADPVVGIKGIDILGDHPGTRADLRGVAGDSGDAMATTQGFFQQLATGTAGGTNDCDLAHDILQLA